MLKITSKEKDLLIAIADYQILLIEQISFITGSGKREVQRKINNLHKKDLINFVSRKLRGKRGRSENITNPPPYSNSICMLYEWRDYKTNLFQELYRLHLPHIVPVVFGNSL